MKRPFTVDDVAKIKLVGDPQLSPGASRAAFVLTQMDLQEDVYRSHIWAVSTDGGDPVRLTDGPGRDTAPRWSPDGARLAFLSDRSGTTHLWLLDLDSGEPRQLTSIPGGASSPSWSPDGKSIAVVSRVQERPPSHDTRVARVITELRYRTEEEGYVEAHRRHIFVIELEGQEVRQLTVGDWDDSWPTWSPDGRSIAFVSSRGENRDYTSVSDLWLVSSQSGEPQKLTRSLGPVHSPAWSPDGLWLAYRGHEQGNRGSANNRIYAVDANGGPPRCLTAEMDRNVGIMPLGDTLPIPYTPTTLAWAADTDLVYFQCQDGGNAHLYTVNLGGQVHRVTSGDMVCHGYSVSQDPSKGSVVYLASDPVNPGDLFLISRHEAAPRKLTDANKGLLLEVELSEPESIRYESHDGTLVEGWSLKPPRLRAGDRCPLVLEIHGGPYSAYGNTFTHEFHLLAAQGMAVLYTNPRGSLGYGEAFAQKLTSDWGTADFPDLMAGVDHAIGQGYVDADRLGVTGGSYGGYMTNWIISHTERFSAAVTDRCESNLISVWGTADPQEMLLTELEFGLPYETPEAFLDHSPIMYAHRIKTPLLMIHGEADYRCPVSEAEQLFSALKRRGQEVVFVRYPGENHGLSRSGTPSRRLDRLQRIAKWFVDHLPKEVQA